MGTKSYWVQYRYFINGEWEVLDEFIEVGEGCYFPTIRDWWANESTGYPHEILQVVKL